MDPRQRAFLRAIEQVLREIEEAQARAADRVIEILSRAQRQVLADLARASTDWQAYHLPRLRAAIEEQMRSFEQGAAQAIREELSRAFDLGKALVDAPLAAAEITVLFPEISRSALFALQDYAASKIRGLAEDAIQKITNEVTLGLLGNRTPFQVLQAVGTTLADPGIYKSIATRAELITKTEMGRVQSVAAQLRREEAARFVPGLKKIWRHAGHPKIPRPDHLAADGQMVGNDEPFVVGGEDLMFPRDPAGSPENTSNGGWDALPWMEVWQQ
jgi:hypothetical protein